jgi:hypothetical protein
LLITYGFSQRLAAILFLASALPVGVLLLYLQTMSTAAPLVVLAARLERKLSIKDSLAATYARSHMRPLAGVVDIESLSDDEQATFGAVSHGAFGLVSEFPGYYI